ncbi:MAG TPA: nucleotide exchange factor GrpE [Pyrinomonadaceae bacterium]|jgi:molecular chaperone GrpE
MIPNKNLKNKEDFSKEIGTGEQLSVDDFIKQLEAKEKDLHISSDLVIEFGESDVAETCDFEFTDAQIPFQNENALPEQPAESISPNNKAFSELEDEVSRLKTLITKMEAERVEIYENSRRRQKDFENYKNRTERERHETFANQVNNLAMQMLPVLDNLNRALDFANRAANKKEKEFEQFFQGIFLVNKQLNEVLAGMGVSPIKAVGENFDPHYHEAVAIEETDVYPPKTVSTELLRGYRIGERVIRPSMVKVAAAVQTQSASIQKEKVESKNEILLQAE